jgi:NitT/TauT family transport system permease protein
MKTTDAPSASADTDAREDMKTGVAAPTRPRSRLGTTWGLRLQRWVVRLTSLTLAVLAWHALTSNDVEFGLRFDQLPGPVEVYHAFLQAAGTTQYHLDLAQSLVRILTGFAIAAAAGIALGILLARSRWASDLVQPLLEVARPIPAIALVPVAILIFPTNELGIVFITSTAAFFPILVSTRHAVRALPTVWEDALLTMGAGRLRVLRTVVLPGVVPGVFGGLSVGMGVAWICVISAEMISGDLGIGYRTWQAYTIVDYPSVLVGMLSIGAIGWLTSGAVELLGKRLTRWLASEQGGQR